MSGESHIMLNDEEVVVRREAEGLGGGTVVVDGKRIKRDHTEFTLRCNVQPVSGNELMLVPEGDRFDDQMWCYVADRESPVQANDLLYRADDGWYQVQATEGWGSYTRARMVRVDVGPGRATVYGPRPQTGPTDQSLQ